jgi:OTU-like cysteine protease
MRVILSTAYCNPQRSESALELVEDFETTSRSEHFGTDENQPPVDTTFLEYSSSVQNTSERSNSVEVFTSAPKVELKLETLDCSNDLERKLPALPQQNERHKPDDRQALHQSHRKRSLQHIESKSRNSCDSSYHEAKKPAAKMTAERYKTSDREPPPTNSYRDENEKEPTISVIHYQLEHQQSALDKPLLELHQYQNFIKALKERGLEIRRQEGDGNCLFRAVSLQVYGDPNMHMDVRIQCLDHMAKDEEHFSQFVEDEDFSNYIQRKRREGVHGNSPEIQAISELFNRPVEVFTPENGAIPLNIFQSDYKTSDVPIRLSYHENHYDAVVDPLLPTAGLGLGLPGLQPGLADKLQIGKAVQESDELADQAELERVLEESHNDEMQRALKESTLSVDMMYSETALALSDLEATNLDLEQAVSIVT